MTLSRREYRVIPAPTRGRKAAGVKTPEGRFALGLEDALNEMAREGWSYLRSDILPSEERQGLTSTATVYRSVLVFAREIASLGFPEEEGPERRTMRPPEDQTETLDPAPRAD